MNREAKKMLIVALCKGGINKWEASQLIQSKGKIVVNLSRSEKKNNPTVGLLMKVPNLKSHFKIILDLGEGVKPLYF